MSPHWFCTVLEQLLDYASKCINAGCFSTCKLIKIAQDLCYSEIVLYVFQCFYTLLTSHACSCVSLRPGWRWFLTVWQQGCSEPCPDYWTRLSYPLILCSASCLSAASVCLHCSWDFDRKHLQKPSIKGVWTVSARSFCVWVHRHTCIHVFRQTFRFDSFAGRPFGELVCQRWALFLAFFEWFCSWCVLESWVRRSCRSSGRSCQCCCSTHRFTTSFWQMPLCCRRSYNSWRYTPVIHRDWFLYTSHVVWSSDYTLFRVCVFQRFSRGVTREQWVTDLLYSYSLTVAHSSSAHRGNLGLRDMY